MIQADLKDITIRGVTGLPNSQEQIDVSDLCKVDVDFLRGKWLEFQGPSLAWPPSKLIHNFLLFFSGDGGRHKYNLDLALGNF